MPEPRRPRSARAWSFARFLASGACLGLAGLLAHAARAEEAPTPPVHAGTKTYALVAAFPDRFSVVYEATPGDRGGAYVGRFRRSTLEGPAGTFNRIALAALQKAVSSRDPEAKHVYMAMPGATPRRVPAADREDFLLKRVASELEGMPARRDWHRIVVAVPYYRAHAFDRMPESLEGFGVFLQPNCESDPYSCSMRFRGAGPDAQTPEGETIRVNHFVAPYSYISIAILDPATLAVIDREHVYDHQKLYDPLGGLDLGQNIDRQVLAGKVVGLIEQSVGNAVARTELAGKVEIREIREVTPGRAPK